jgi:hypothetical protein
MSADVDLELEMSDAFAARERLIHRIALAAMMLIIVAGLLGAFGFGPLSVATRTGSDYRLTYDRLARNGAPFAIEVQTTTGRRSQVWIDRWLLDATRLERVVPEPSEERPHAGGVTFVFAEPAGAPPHVTFHFVGDAVGAVRGRVGRSPTDAVGLSVFFYP